MSDYFIDEIQDYLEVLCEDHKQVNHNMLDTEDNKPFRSFARFESHEHISQLTNKAGKCVVIMVDCFGQRILHQDDDRVRQTLVIRFAVYKQSGEGNETNSINEAIKKAMRIMFDFLNRIQNDAAVMCEEVRDLEPDLATWDKIEDQPWLDSYYGWDLTIPYRGFMPAYDPTQWRSDNTVLPVVPAPDGVPASSSKYQLLMRFVVGAAGAPMNDGDDLLTHPGLENKYVQVFVGNGMKIPEFVAGITAERYITKYFAEDEINFIGGVTKNEVIEVYTYEVETA